MLTGDRCRCRRDGGRRCLHEAQECWACTAGKNCGYVVRAAVALAELPKRPPFAHFFQIAAHQGAAALQSGAVLDSGALGKDFALLLARVQRDTDLPVLVGVAGARGVAALLVADFGEGSLGGLGGGRGGGATRRTVGRWACISHRKRQKKEGAALQPVRTVVPCSLWLRGNGKLLHKTCSRAIKNATGDHQGATGQKFGDGQIQISSKAYLAQHEYAGRGMSDLTAGFPNTLLEVAASIVAQECPELHGHFMTCHAHGPLAWFIEIGTDVEARLKTMNVDNGLIQGETMSSDIFTMLGKRVRDANNDVNGQHHKDYLDDSNFLAVIQNDDGTINRGVVNMMAATKAAVASWGGKFKASKTFFQVNKMSDHVLTIVQEITELVGGKITLVCPEKIPQAICNVGDGLVCLGGGGVRYGRIQGTVLGEADREEEGGRLRAGEDGRARHHPDHQILREPAIFLHVQGRLDTPKVEAD